MRSGQFWKAFTAMCSKESLIPALAGTQRYSISSVVFDDDCSSWENYLELSMSQRYEPEILVAVKPISKQNGFCFSALNKNSDSEELVSLLKEGLDHDWKSGSL